MRHRLVIASLFLVLLGAGHARPAAAETFEALFAEGNAAFFQGDFADAIARYKTLIDAGVQDPDVYFNLATAYGRTGALGQAILNFERARRLAPGDSAVAEHLTAARELLARRTAERTGEATMRTRPPIREALVGDLSEDSLAWALCLLNFLCFAALIVRRYLKHESARLGTVIVAGLSGLFGLLAAAGLAVKLGTGQPGKAVVVLADQALREGPDPKAQSRGDVMEGSLARAMGKEGRWVRVRVQDGEAGWLPRQSVGYVNPD